MSSSFQPTLLSSSVSKSSSVAIPRRPAADDSLLLSYGATAPHPRIRRPSDERYDERKFNPYRAVVGSAGSPCALAGTGGNTNTVGLVKPANVNPVNFVFDPSSRQVKTGRALINPFDPSVRISTYGIFYFRIKLCIYIFCVCVCYRELQLS